MWKTTLLLSYFRATPTQMPLLHKDETFTFRLSLYFYLFLSFSFFFSFFFFFLIHCFGSFYCNPSTFISSIFLGRASKQLPSRLFFLTGVFGQWLPTPFFFFELYECLFPFYHYVDECCCFFYKYNSSLGMATLFPQLHSSLDLVAGFTFHP